MMRRAAPHEREDHWMSFVQGAATGGVATGLVWAGKSGAPWFLLVALVVLIAYMVWCQYDYLR